MRFWEVLALRGAQVRVLPSPLPELAPLATPIEARIRLILGKRIDRQSYPAQVYRLGPNGADAGMMHDIALAWLQLRARQYVAQNAGTDGALMVTDLLRAELRAMNVIPSLPATEVARTRWSPN